MAIKYNNLPPNQAYRTAKANYTTRSVLNHLAPTLNCSIYSNCFQRLIKLLCMCSDIRVKLFQGPIVPCTHALLAKWIPPSERSRMAAAVYAGDWSFFRLPGRYLPQFKFT